MGLAIPSAPSAVATADAAIRVMVVDDSVVVRGLVSRWIEEEPGLALAGSMRNGRDAVDHLERINPDVVILDIEMPELDGISALPLMLAKKRDLVIIMASTLTRHNAEVSLKALSLGAADYISKPETNRGVTTSAIFRRDLIEKVRELGGRRRKRRAPAAPGTAPSPAAQPAPARAPEPPIKLRAFAPTSPRVLVIGSSTGGPQALTTVMSNLRGVLSRVPVLITQHMPPTFTTILAEHIARAASGKAHEGIDGEPVEAGTIYVAPGGKHMQAVKRDNGVFIALDDGPLVNFCKPAVDPLFRSAAAVWGSAVLAVVLTGMGSDGAKGGADIVAHGGSVIAQDEATSVVWGMPGAAAHAGICSAVLPLDQIAPKVARLFSGERS
ncbi:MAG TPA: chemotaxis response regulator protein-glutamate methylesterase [Xanthobacteraceae bacterium]|jgi:two-component system, chemotaxis family, protein-glutamate methylesterase/glutaminase